MFLQEIMAEKYQNERQSSSIIQDSFLPVQNDGVSGFFCCLFWMFCLRWGKIFRFGQLLKFYFIFLLKEPKAFHLITQIKFGVRFGYRCSVN